MGEINFQSRNAKYDIENGILVCEANADIILDLKMAVKLVNERLKITKHTQYPFLLSVSDYLLFDKEAFKYFGTPEGVQNLTACAIVVDSPLQRLITNFSLMFYKQKVPFRIFNKSSEAKLWLFQYVLELEKKEARNKRKALQRIPKKDDLISF